MNASRSIFVILCLTALVAACSDASDAGGVNQDIAASTGGDTIGTDPGPSGAWDIATVETSVDPEELKAGEITEAKLRTIEGVHKSMLKDLFSSMDEDGGGLLDQDELRILSLSLGYRVR